MKIKFLNEAVDKDTGHIDPSPKSEAEVKDLKDKEIQPIATPEEAAARASIQSNKDNADKAIKASDNTKNGEDLKKELSGDRTKAPKTPKMKPYTEDLKDDNEMTLDDYFNKDKEASKIEEDIKIKPSAFKQALKFMIDAGYIDNGSDASTVTNSNTSTFSYHDQGGEFTIKCNDDGSIDFKSSGEDEDGHYKDNRLEHFDSFDAFKDWFESTYSCELEESKKCKKKEPLKIKDRKELAQHINEAKKNNKK